MNPRHAAALALVGWCLVLPPASESFTFINSKAPLSQWTLDGQFDSAQNCENRRQQLIHENWKSADEKRRFQLSRCVPRDDPRLKEK